MATVRPYPDDAPFVPIKRDDPIPQNLTLRGTPRKSRHRGVRTKIRDPLFVKACFSLALGKEPMTTAQIARQLRTNPSTVQYILDAGDIEQQRRDSVKLLARSLTEVTEMVLEDTIAKRDRRLGFDIMAGSGILDAARPQQQREEGGRIVIEWNGPPPPWAPQPILQAHAMQPAPPDEPKKGSVVAAAPPIPDAEVVSEVPEAADAKES